MIAETLAALPVDATDTRKRDAVSRAYPFGERADLPYTHWCRAQRAALGSRGSRPPNKRPIVPVVAIDGIADSTLAHLLLALASDSADEATQAAVLDRMEETGHGNATAARAFVPTAEQVVMLMYPRATIFPSRGKLMVLAQDGTDHRFNLAVVADQLARRTLLIDPTVTTAARTVRGRTILRLALEGGDLDAG